MLAEQKRRVENTDSESYHENISGEKEQKKLQAINDSKYYLYTNMHIVNILMLLFTYFPKDKNKKQEAQRLRKTQAKNIVEHDLNNGKFCNRNYYISIILIQFIYRNRWHSI